MATFNPDATFERRWLDETSWVDVCRGWLSGTEDLYAASTSSVSWNQGKVFRYEKYVDEPRLGGYWRVGDPVVSETFTEAHRSLQHRYKVRFDGFALAWYRDGNDCVAFHRDREMRWLDDTVIGILTLGVQRPFLLRSRANRFGHGESDAIDLAPAAGDLLVMGGRCQADYEHSVPKVDPRVGGRVSLQWRWTSKQGQMQRGGGYRSPRTYSR